MRLLFGYGSPREQKEGRGEAEGIGERKRDREGLECLLESNRSKANHTWDVRMKKE